MKSLIRFIKRNEQLKQFVHFLLVPKNQAKPRKWVRWILQPWYIKKGKNALICSHVRLDVLPNHGFSLGNNSTIEDFCTINNGVGDVQIADFVRIGIGSVLIGPVEIKSKVMLAQNVVISGLNHGYEDPDIPISDQPVSTKPILIEENCWIGANAVITAGVKIGKHSIVAAGSVVTKNVKPYTIVGGNPAQPLKEYDFEIKVWKRIK